MAKAAPHFPGNSDDVKTFAMFVMNGDVKMLELELKSDPALVNAKNAEGYPMLHVAVMEAQKEMVEFLLEKGADPKALDDFRETADSLATRLGFTPLAQKIAAAVARIDGPERLKREFEKALEGFSKGGGHPISMPKPKYRWTR